MQVDGPPSDLPPTVLARAALLRRWVAVAPVWLLVHGRSMHPVLRDGWEVRVAPGTRPRRGEVWAFTNPDGAIVVHRCRRPGEGVHLFAGDAYLVADPPVRDEVLIGRVSAVRGAGTERALTWRDGITWRLANTRRVLRARVTCRSDQVRAEGGHELPLE